MDFDSVFSDVLPIPLDEGPNPMSPIAYPQEYSKAMDYFRACARTNEKSQRVLDLTSEIIDLNPAHYTVWKVRQESLVALGSDLRKELEYTTTVGLEHHKNYQVWHHREVIVTLIGLDLDVIAKEKKYINDQFEIDAKNYHAWSYRQWLVRKFNAWEQELEDIDNLIEQDCRNNSAWNHRYFYFTSRPEGFDADSLSKEIQFSLDHVRKTPNNESPWNYLKGPEVSEQVLNASVQDVKILITENEFVLHGATFLLDFFESRLEAENDSAKKKEANEEAKKLCNDLIKFDIIRIKFWNYRLSLLQ
ncbi:UNVERIFIED_CONTAM: CAAX geranylgeranyltransferase alpha subunit [Siphonaria sp. JEL0065]|nr:CAAX geranylgeranyltransferase alpha subunit [Siphonaria sp. JEL0065]